MSEIINHKKYYNTRQAIGKVKNFFKSSNGDHHHTPEKPGESESIEIIFPETHFKVTFDPSRVVIESNVDVLTNDLIAHLEILATESIRLTAIFDCLETLSGDYKYISTQHSESGLTVVRFEKGEITALLIRKTVGNKEMLLIEPIEGEPLEPFAENLIKAHLREVEKIINT